MWVFMTHFEVVYVVVAKCVSNGGDAECWCGKGEFAIFLQVILIGLALVSRA